MITPEPINQGLEYRDSLDLSYVSKLKSVSGCPGLCLTQDMCTDNGRRWHLRDCHNADVESYGIESS